MGFTAIWLNPTNKSSFRDAEYAYPDTNKPWQLPVTHPDCVATKNELIN